MWVNQDLPAGSPPCPPRGETVTFGFVVAYKMVSGSKGLVTAMIGQVSPLRPLEGAGGGRSGLIVELLNCLIVLALGEGSEFFHGRVRSPDRALVFSPRVVFLQQAGKSPFRGFRGSTILGL